MYEQMTAPDPPGDACRHGAAPGKPKGGGGGGPWSQPGRGRRIRLRRPTSGKRSATRRMHELAHPGPAFLFISAGAWRPWSVLCLSATRRRRRRRRPPVGSRACPRRSLPLFLFVHHPAVSGRYAAMQQKGERKKMAWNRCGMQSYYLGVTFHFHN